LTALVKPVRFVLFRVNLPIHLEGMNMKKYIILIALALFTMTCAVLEGLVEVPVQFIQLNGLMAILGAMMVIFWTLKMQAEAFAKD
jgi:hypothetical protein